jgi:hypothetical protein
MNNYIDIYCERTMPGLWSEPFNAISNVAFFIAAWAIWRLAQRQRQIQVSTKVLASLAIAIGIGSTLFHTFATEWANILDVLPIFFFQLCFLWFYCRQVIRLNNISTGGLIAIFFIASTFSQQFTAIFNGSLSYAPAFLFLLGLGLYHYQQRKRERTIFLTAPGIFLLALTCRTMDPSICPYFVIGTHFLWHLFNGALLYLTTRGLLLNDPALKNTSAS